MMKKPKKHISLILILGLFAGLALLLREPTTERLIQQLEENQFQYDTILEMLSKDGDVGTIRPDSVDSLKKGVTIITNHYEEAASDLKISEERLLEYREMMKSIGVDSFIRNCEDDVYFNIRGSYKGIVWIPESSTSTTNTGFQLIKIKDGWYIFSN
jgi:uncharacterized protein with GYD domain